MSDAMDETMHEAISAAIRDAADRQAEHEFTKIIAELTPGDLALVTTLAEALRKGEVTVEELNGLTDEEWMSLIAFRRAA